MMESPAHPADVQENTPLQICSHAFLSLVTPKKSLHHLYDISSNLPAVGDLQ